MEAFSILVADRAIQGIAEKNGCGGPVEMNV